MAMFPQRWHNPSMRPTQKPPQRDMTMSEDFPNPTPSVERQRRRRLLKALIGGLPAVITLRSGAALALTTSSGRCYLEVPIAPGMHCATDENNFVGAGEPRGNLTPAPNQGKYQMFLESNYAGGDDVNGDGDQTDLCVVYVDSNNNPPTIPGGPNYGEVAPPGNTQPNTAAGIYAVSASCWSSMFNG